MPAPQPRAVHDSDDEEAQVQWSVHDGAHAYEPHEVMPALEAALGRDVRLFSGTTMDSRIVAISREAMARYLAANPVDQRQYIRDSGGRNYDCDDFALTLRSNLIRDHGYNCCRRRRRRRARLQCLRRGGRKRARGGVRGAPDRRVGG